MLCSSQGSTTTSLVPLQPRDVVSTVTGQEKRKEGMRALPIRVQQQQLLAEGGYNRIWSVSSTWGTGDVASGRTAEVKASAKQLILRVPKEDALLPYQIWNEVAFRRFVQAHLPQIPVPNVHAFRARESGDDDTIETDCDAFILEDLIVGKTLSDMWNSYSEQEKFMVADQIADVIVRLGETTFEKIGGLMPDGNLGPTVEGTKLFKGRSKFHHPVYYNIGPYSSTKDYVIACYDKEICYYTNASNTDIDWCLFDTVTKDEFLATLRAKRDSLLKADWLFPKDEPFVLVHGDLHGRNIMMNGARIVSVLDWEFAGAYPLSELLGGGSVDVVEDEDDDSMDENDRWARVIRQLVKGKVQEHEWPRAHVDWLLGPGNYELQRARVEMFPRDC